MALGKQIHWETGVKAMNQQSAFAVHHAECGLTATWDDFVWKVKQVLSRSPFENISGGEKVWLNWTYTL